MNWSNRLPTKPGTYFMNYKGARWRKRRTECVVLGFPPKGQQLPHDQIAFKHVDKMHPEGWFSDIHMRVDCYPVWWYGPIQLPPVPKLPPCDKCKGRGVIEGRYPAPYLTTCSCQEPPTPNDDDGTRRGASAEGAATKHLQERNIE